MLKGKSSNRVIKRGKLGKRIKKDYQYKSLNNPFFRSKKKTKEVKKNKKKYFLIALVFVIFLFLVYTIFISQTFRIDNINISGLERIDNNTVRDFVQHKLEKNKFLLFPQSNLLFVDSNKLADSIKKEYKLANSSVYKNFFHSLEIKLVERPLAFIWQDGNQVVFSDEYGCLIREIGVNAGNRANLPLLESELGISYLKDDDCLDLADEYFVALFDLNRELAAYPSLTPDKFVVSSELNSLVVDLNKGPNIIFNTKEDSLKQINKLLIIQQEQDEQKFLSLEYIDLRFGDLIYFK